MTLTDGYRKTRIVTRLHIVKKPRNGGPRWYVYAWRGGPCIHQQDIERPVITPELLDKVSQLRLKQASGGERTLDMIIQQYSSSPNFMELAEATKRDYRRWLNRLSERFGKAPIGAFSDIRMREQIILWRDKWAHQPRTADKATVMTATVLGWCVERGILPTNVAAGIKCLHHVNKADQIWEERHWQAIADHKDDAGKLICPPQLMSALKLAKLTGLRLKDLVSLDWSHVSERAIIIVTQKRKGRAVIPILPELRTFLDGLEHREGVILRNSRGRPWTESGLGSVFQKKMPPEFDRTMHDLRGTYATWLATKGLTDDEIARIIGWTAKRISEIRARYVDEARVIVSLVERLSA